MKRFIGTFIYTMTCVLSGYVLADEPIMHHVAGPAWEQVLTDCNQDVEWPELETYQLLPADYYIRGYICPRGQGHTPAVLTAIESRDCNQDPAIAYLDLYWTCSDIEETKAEQTFDLEVTYIEGGAVSFDYMVREGAEAQLYFEIEKVCDLNGVKTIPMKHMAVSIEDACGNIRINGRNEPYPITSELGCYPKTTVSATVTCLPK